MVKVRKTVYMAILTGLLIICSGCIGNNRDEELNTDSLGTDEQTGVEDREAPDDISIEDEYNSIELNLYTKGMKPLLGEIDVFSVYSKTNAYENIEEAEKSGAIKNYTDESNRYTFLLKEGYKLNGKINPLDKESTAGWSDYKSNCPFEIEAITNGNNKITSFDIEIDYESEIVSTEVKVHIYN